MLTEHTRAIVEDALGRALTAEEEGGYASLAALPANVIASVETIRRAGNLATASAYLRHVVPSASLAEIRELLDELSTGRPA